MTKHFLYTFLVAGFLGGLLLTWQFSANIPTVGNFPSDEITAKEELLKSFLDDQSYSQSQIVTLHKEIEEAQNNIETQSSSVNVALLESLKKDVGLSEVMGDGLEILLDDSKSANRATADISSVNLVQASDIRDVVNILNAAKSDAIAVNGQRIIANSTISSVGTTMLVNNSHIAPPFVISAVGSPEIMAQRLLNKSLLPELYSKRSKSNVIFEIHKKGRISIPIYNGDLKTTYLNLVQAK